MAMYRKHLIKLMTFLITTTVGDSGCLMKRDDYGHLVADCKGRSLFEIPDNLDPTIQSLDMSKNHIDELKPGFSKRYRKLENFTLTSKDFNEGPPYRLLKVDNNTFADLQNLKLLDLSRNVFEPGTKFVFPPNIEILALGGTDQNTSTFDISRLRHLRMLEMKDNLLTQFPVMYKTAPLWYCDIRRNPLVLIPAEEIARYCKLQFLHFTVNEDILKDCTCWQIRAWIEARNLDGVSLSSLKCNPTKECPRPYITRKMEKLYTNCMENRGGGFFGKVGLYLVFLVSILISMVIIGLGFWYYKRREPKQPETVKPTAEPDISEESAEEEQGLNVF